MELRSAAKKVARPAATLFTKAVTRAIGGRLSAIEQAHGVTSARVQHLEAGLPECRSALDALDDTVARLVSQLVAVEHAYDAARSEIDEMETWVPAVLDASAVQHATTRAEARRESRRAQQTKQHAQRLDNIEGRIEFVRRELLYELRYGGRGRGIGVAPGEGTPSLGVAVAVEPKVLNGAKLADFGDDIRLNLGAGHVPVEGYLNVDARELDGTDILADVRALPFGPGEVSTIFCAHLLEHFPGEEVRRLLLPYWRSLLKPGGRFITVVPDGTAMLAGYARDEISFDDLREVTFGAQEYDGDFHFNMYSEDSLTALLSEAGFTDVAITVSARRNGLCYEMQAEGQRPDDTPGASDH
jgi:SAM-dependent methyltransferase